MVRGTLFKPVKVILLVVTSLICIMGFAIFAVGIWASMQKQESVEELLGSALYTTATHLLIAAGISIAFLSALGCCGAWKEERFKLGLYFIVLLMAFMILFAGAIMGFLFKDKAEEKLLDRMNVTVQQYGEKHGEKDTKSSALDAIQMNFQCCGIDPNDTKNGYKIWEENEYLKNRSLAVPASCCKDKEKIAECQKIPKNNVYDTDCYTLLKNYIKTNSKIIGAVGIGIALFLMIGMILTCIVYRAI